MSISTFMIMKAGAVMCVYGTDVAARMLVHGACERLESFLMYLLQLSRGLSQPYLLVPPLV